MAAALLIETLVKTYGSTHAVRDVSLRVEEGRIFGLVGPNGSGKTTTLSCALGLLRPDSGRIEVLGRTPSQLHRSAGAIGVMFDDPMLLPGLSLRANLEYARRLLGHTGGRTAEEALELVGLAEIPARRRARGLSLGQRRRLALARTLLGRPKLLILDEPLSGLDTVGVRDMLALFRRLRDEGLTIVLSSHRLFEMERLVDDVAILLAGEVVRQAPLSELLAEQSRHVELHAKPLDEVRVALANLEGLGAFVALDAARLRVDLGTVAPGALARALHEAGCTLEALVPERQSLQAVFEALVDERIAPAAVAP